MDVLVNFKKYEELNATPYLFIEVIELDSLEGTAQSDTTPVYRFDLDSNFIDKNNNIRFKDK